LFVPVVNLENEPLMPTTPGRARKWGRSGKATPFFKKGVYCVRLNIEPSDHQKQDVCVGIDPGSKREAYTIKSRSHTYLNVLTETPHWVSKTVEVRRNMRRARRFRLRRRPSRFNNRRGSFLAPSTRARWGFKINICKWLKKMFPITHFIVEDIKARTWKGSKKWNRSFSPLEVGKQWFYTQIEKLGELHLKQGYETKELRDELGLKKSKSKLADKFECHNVDSWVLANWYVGGHAKPENKSILKVIPLRFHRRQLHVLQASVGGKRRKYGSTRSLGFKRGSLVKHKKYGLSYVGGTSGERISLHSVRSGVRLSQSVKKVSECVFRSFSCTRSVLFCFLC